MGRLSFKTFAASRGVTRIASRIIVVTAAATGLTACAYSDPHHRSYSYHSHGYGYGSGTRIAMDTHHPDAVYRTHRNRARVVSPRRHVVVPGTHHVVVPGGHYVKPHPGHSTKPPHMAPRPPVKPGVRPPHAGPRPGTTPPHQHARPESRPGRHHARPESRPGHHNARPSARPDRHVRPGNVQRPAGSAGTRRPDAHRSTGVRSNSRTGNRGAYGSGQGGSRR